MMDPMALFGGVRLPSIKFKVYAPDGETREYQGCLGIRVPNVGKFAELFFQHADGRIEVLSKKVVVENLETNEVCYDPRRCPSHASVGNETRIIIDNSLKKWLAKNPHWPAVLELEDNPVHSGEETDGINP